MLTDVVLTEYDKPNDCVVYMTIYGSRIKRSEIDNRQNT